MADCFRGENTDESHSGRQTLVGGDPSFRVYSAGVQAHIMNIAKNTIWNACGMSEEGRKKRL